MEKKFYEESKVEVLCFDDSDVITASGGDDNLGGWHDTWNNVFENVFDNPEE